MNYRIGIDAGGTFTDFVALAEDHSLLVYKTPSDPSNPVSVLLDGLTGLARKAGLELPDFISRCAVLVHGSTVALNTLIQRNGARTGLLVTAGHEDSLELRLGHKEDGHRWDFHYPPAEMIVPAQRRLGVRERIIAGGKVRVPLDEAQLDEQLDRLAQEQVEAVAISCLWSIANDRHERKILEKAKQRLPDCFVTASVDILPRVGEYARTSTTAANAYVGPVLDRYLSSIETALVEQGFTGRLYIMQSNGGVAAPEVVRRRPAAVLNSGPAGGPVAALWYGRQLGYENVISMDMGGTSFDVSLVRNGLPDVVDQADIARIRIGLPMVNVTSIGAGGGSIARLDERGILQVGPDSAEANPGPACYMRGGTKPTVTDALVTAGYFPDTGLLGGRMMIDRTLAEQVIQDNIAAPAGIDLHKAAQGIIEVTAGNMVDGIRIASIERGYDPRDYLLVAGGGAGPAFAAELARELGMEKVLIPTIAGAFCAMGEANANLRYDAIRACPVRLCDLSPAVANKLFDLMEEEGRTALGVGAGDRVRVERTAEMKYVDQIHYCDVQAPAGVMDVPKLAQLRNNFHRRHEELYTYSETDNEPEIVSLRASIIIDTPAPTGAGPEQAAALNTIQAQGTREVIMPDTKEFQATPIYRGIGNETGRSETGDRPPLTTCRAMPKSVPGSFSSGSSFSLQGPAIIEEETTTIFIPAGDTIRYDPAGFYLLEVYPRS